MNTTAAQSPTEKKFGQRVHFIGIGGAAMHSLALAVAAKPGYVVTGSDNAIYEPAYSHLKEAGILPEKIEWDPSRITPDIDFVILGMKARIDNPELLRAQELGIRVLSFPEYLYQETQDKVRIVVGGSHGKSTTTSMILYALRELGIECDYMVGAQIDGFERMVRLSDTAKYAVFEGDEYLTSPLDRRSKFLWYKPEVAILTGIAWDHINVFPTFPEYVETFRKFTQSISRAYIYYGEDENLRMLAGEQQDRIQCLPYAEAPHTIRNGRTYILLPNGEEQPISVFGRHNMQNLQAACLACEQIGIRREDFFRAISTFTGAGNRLEKVAETEHSVAYKDFAHSPSKLKATLNAVREQYPDKKLVACMELHTFSSLMADFLPQYKDSMEKADVAIVYYSPEGVADKRLPPIYPEQVATGFASPNVEVITSLADMQTRLRQEDYDNTALLMMTSGNFDGMDIAAFANEVLK